MNHVSIDSIVHAESMTGIVLILVVVAAKATQNWLRRLSLSRLTLETESSTLNLQIQPHLSPQELQRQAQQGDDDHGNSNDDNGRIPEPGKRTHF